MVVDEVTTELVHSGERRVARAARLDPAVPGVGHDMAGIAPLATTRHRARDLVPGALSPALGSRCLAIGSGLLPDKGRLGAISHATASVLPD